MRQIKIEVFKGPITQYFANKAWESLSSEKRFTHLRDFLTAKFYLGRTLYQPFKMEGFSFTYSDYRGGERTMSLSNGKKLEVWRVDEKEINSSI